MTGLIVAISRMLYQRVEVVAQWKSTHLVIWRSWVRNPPVAGLRSPSSFSPLYSFFLPLPTFLHQQWSVLNQVPHTLVDA